jgi:hypothetical protein
MVNYSLQNATADIKTYLDSKGAIFNPSIGHLKDKIYIFSVRSFANDITDSASNFKDPYRNKQHPWKTNWKGIKDKKEDCSYIFPVTITDESFTVKKQKDWPIKLEVQDLRIYKLFSDENIHSYILTYNRFELSEVSIKNGDCEDGCYVIGWSYLVVKDDLSYNILHSKDPLCSNISERLEKNWSLWSISNDEKIAPMISYMLTPEHTAFSWRIDGVDSGLITGGYSCKLLNPDDLVSKNIFAKLQDYYKDLLYVSLSTPAYKSNDGYLAVGHMKARISEMDRYKSSLLYTFYKNAKSDYTHPTFIYFMFFYRFTVNEDLSVPVTDISPAFIVQDDTNYLLNFPSGLWRDRYRTFVSYGNGDSEAKILKLSNNAVNKLLEPVADIKVEKYEFLFL